MFTCDICGATFKDFRNGGYVQNLITHCPACDERPGIPVTVIEEGQTRTIYTKSISEALKTMYAAFHGGEEVKTSGLLQKSHD